MDPNDFAALVRGATGLDIAVADLALPFDQLPAWDSMYLLTLATAVESATGAPLSVADAIECASLGALRELIPA
jgi:acyl carrier protein